LALGPRQNEDNALRWPVPRIGKRSTPASRFRWSTPPAEGKGAADRRAAFAATNSSACSYPVRGGGGKRARMGFYVGKHAQFPPPFPTFRFHGSAPQHIGGAAGPWLHLQLAARRDSKPISTPPILALLMPPRPDPRTGRTRIELYGRAGDIFRDLRNAYRARPFSRWISWPYGPLREGALAGRCRRVGL